MSDEIYTGLTNWLITSVIGMGTIIIGWLMNRAIVRLDNDLDAHEGRLNDHDKQHTTCSLDLERFKTDVANNYAKEVTMQNSLARIHDRIDEVSTDIKTILGKVK